MFIDTHCHIDSYERHSGESLSSLLERLPHDADPKVTLPEAFIHVACDPKDFEYARELSEKYPNVYAAYGIHPEYVLTETAEDEARMMEFLKHPKCVACGEFGLDYHYDLEHRAEQVKLFERHLQLGIESGKPLVLHLREADEDALAVLRNADLQAKNVMSTALREHRNSQGNSWNSGLVKIPAFLWALRELSPSRTPRMCGTPPL